jgi:hypothetical protein
MTGPGPFSAHARQLIINGYSPMPLWPGKKSPIPNGWQTLREAHITERELQEVEKQYPKAGVGVAGGFNGLVPIDVDTDDKDIREAVRKALPAPVVVKKGKRGATAFYRSRLPISGRKFRDAKGNPIVEVLTTVQTVIPPTMHPDTGKPYVWTTAATLFYTCVDDLPEITIEHLTALQEALRPWMASPKAHRPRTGNGNGSGVHKPTEARLRAYAAAALAGEAKQLAGTGEGGRNHGLFVAVCRLGNYVHHKVLSQYEVHAALLVACNANGFNAEHGTAAFEKTFANGLQWSEDDELREPPPGKEQPRDDAQHQETSGTACIDNGNGHANGNGHHQSSSNDDAEIARLAKLPLVEYDRQREASAKMLSCRPATLDAAVKNARGDAKQDGQGRSLSLPEPVPCEDLVDGPEMLNAIVECLRRYVVLAVNEARAIALWVVHTYFFDGFTCTPRLAITSPEKRCGKTTLLDILARLLPRALPVASISASAIFRTVELVRPTLLIDEADTFLRHNDEVRGILNSGHRKGGSVVRTVGDNHEPRQLFDARPCRHRHDWQASRHPRGPEQPCAAPTPTL